VKETIKTILSKALPHSLIDELLDAFEAIQRDVITRRLGGGDAGKFVETYVQILQILETGKFDSPPSVEGYLRPLESRACPLDDGLRVCSSRIARALYMIRSKRNVVHKGEVDMNLIDLRLAHAQARWLLSELVRQVAGSSMAEAGKLIEQLDVPFMDVIEDFGGRRIVTADMSIEDETLALLHSVYPDGMQTDVLKQNMHRRNAKSVEKKLRAMWEDRLIEEVSPKVWKLTQPGHRSATRVLSEYVRQS
jgi:hypothetical protein